MLFNTVH